MSLRNSLAKRASLTEYMQHAAEQKSQRRSREPTQRTKATFFISLPSEGRFIPAAKGPIGLKIRSHSMLVTTFFPRPYPYCVSGSGSNSVKPGARITELIASSRSASFILRLMALVGQTLTHLPQRVQTSQSMAGIGGTGCIPRQEMALRLQKRLKAPGASAGQTALHFSH